MKKRSYTLALRSDHPKLRRDLVKLPPPCSLPLAAAPVDVCTRCSLRLQRLCVKILPVRGER